MQVDIRVAGPDETRLVSEILSEAARWLESRGTPMWPLDDLNPASLSADVAQGLFFVAWCNGEAAGTIRFELDDPVFWPDLPDPLAAYVHRLAVRRRYAGGLVSSALLRCAADHALANGRKLLRLDCEAARMSHWEPQEGRSAESAELIRCRSFRSETGLPGPKSAVGRARN